MISDFLTTLEYKDSELANSDKYSEVVENLKTALTLGFFSLAGNHTPERMIDTNSEVAAYFKLCTKLEASQLPEVADN